MTVTHRPQDQGANLTEFAAACTSWLSDNVERRRSDKQRRNNSFEVFHNLSFDDERALLERGRAWQRARVDAGFGAITWGTEYGGPGLTPSHENIYNEIESEFLVPESHETLSVTTKLVAPTIELLGNEDQKRQFIRPFLHGDALCCQLFSEPEAGSDLAALSTRAERGPSGWTINGQKIWSSGAQFSDWGLLIARTDPAAEKHHGMTAYMMPMTADGVQVRPIKQMSGGSTFNEVYLDDVEIPDSMRIGDVGSGWAVALTTLSFERNAGAGSPSVGGSFHDLLELSRRLAKSSDPVVRQQLVEVFIYDRAASLFGKRSAELRGSERIPGVEGSIGKLVWTQNMKRIGDTAAELLGPRIAADAGEFGTFAWGNHLMGAPGYRIAGGTDEVQRNIIGERGLGLPREAR